MATAETATLIGSRIGRKEDAAMLTGRTTFVDSMTLPGMVWMAVIRSPYAHARIRSVDLSAAASAPGVVAAFSGADLADAWKAGMPCAWPVTEDLKNGTHLPLATEKARYQGDGVAVVLAESRALAKDAAELVEVDYEPLPAVVDVEDAAKDGAPLVHDELGTNVSYVWKLEAGDVDGAFAAAATTVKERYFHPRLIPTAIEPRSVVVQPNAATGDATMWSATQIPHILRVLAAATLGMPESKLRVVAPDVGGGFGSKLNVYAEELLVLALARRLGRPVKWTEERTEGYTATIHGRDVVQEMEYAADADGNITAVRASVTAAMGAYLQLVTPGIPLLGAWLYAGAYDIPAYSFTCTGVFTHTTPTDAYRGAGRPEATFAVERTIDALARVRGEDPVELRRRNLIAEFPKTISSGLTIDAGDYHATLDRCLEQLDYDEVRREQQTRRDRGDTKVIGIGLSTYTEMCGLAPSRILGAIRYAAGGWETATVRCLPTGSIQVLTGTSPHGQGHETAWAQIAADQLGYAIDEVEVLHGDTAVTPFGLDTYGSRSLPVGGVALWNAGLKIVDKARQIAAHSLEVSEDDLDYEAGTFSVKGSSDKAMTVKEASWAAFAAHDLPDGMEPGLEATAFYDPPNFSWPAGAHAAVVEADTETGDARLLRYVAVDDVGSQINPMIVEGQIHGGIAQGVAAALYEEGRYDTDGNLETPNLVNYLVPSAAELPDFELDSVTTPSPTNPLGVKGVGETGTIASEAAVMNAVVDALSHLGVTTLEMPATPERVWRAIEEAQQ
jgi:carbon-monoxide dehydrogenase large subunit